MEFIAYLDNIPPKRQQKFTSMQSLFKPLYPAAVESMQYKLPTHDYKNGWIAIADQKI